MPKKGYKQTKEHTTKINTLKRARKISVTMKGKKPASFEILHTPEINKKRGDAHKGMHYSEESKKKISLSRMGNKNWAKRPEVRKKIAETLRSKKLTGEKCRFWKGGITPLNSKIRQSIEFRLWREAVFARDNWTCQKYRIKGGKLHSHHIQNFAQFPELRFAIDNGITFSEKAHREFHKKYGIKNNTKEQLIEFLK